MGVFVNGKECGYVVVEKDNKIEQYANGTLIELRPEDFGDATKITDYFMRTNTNLDKITTSDKIEEIGSYVCSGCNLEYIDLSQSVNLISIGSSCFETNNSATVILPDTDFELGISCFSLITNYNHNGLYYAPSLNNQYFALYGRNFPTSTTSIEINANCKIIANHIFSYVTSLQNIIFQEGSQLKRIPSYFCQSCSNLQNIQNLPNTIVEIGRYAFSSCSSLTSFDIPDSIIILNRNVFYNCTGLAELSFANDSQLETIGDETFYGCSSLSGSLIIPNGVTSIGHSAFQNCSSITSIIIPESVTNMGNYVCNGCSGLQIITLNGSFTDLGVSSFYNLQQVTKLIYNVKALDNLTYVNCPFKNLGKSTNGVEVIIGEDVEKIPSCLFSEYNNDAPKVKTVKFVDNCKCSIIYGGAFSDLDDLESIKFSDNITTFSGTGCVSYCPKLTQIVFSDTSKLETLSGTAFWHNTGLTYVELPNSLQTIGNQTFQNCTSLTKVRVKATIPPTLQSNGAFSGCPLETIEVPAESVDAYKTANMWSYFADIIVGYTE